MTVTNVTQSIRDYIRRELMADKQDAPLDDDENLIDAGIVDSLGIFLVIAFIESEFAIKIQPEDVVLENFATINTIHRLIARRQPNGSQVAP
jgi:acyl carrier protein